VADPAGIAALDFEPPELEASIWAEAGVDSQLTPKRPEPASWLEVAALVDDERWDQWTASCSSTLTWPRRAASAGLWGIERNDAGLAISSASSP
jgi:hypothetical protein